MFPIRQRRRGECKDVMVGDVTDIDYMTEWDVREGVRGRVEEGKDEDV